MNYLTVAGKKFQIEVAISSEEQERGLMYKDEPFPILAFPSRRPEIRRFWMKNVRGDLDVMFCLNNKISSIWKGEAGSTKMLGNDNLVDMVIECPHGFCKSLGIEAGAEIKIEYSKQAQYQILLQRTGMIF
jgi:uncharacterized membrane protein (UPF0127 family)